MEHSPIECYRINLPSIGFRFRRPEVRSPSLLCNKHRNPATSAFLVFRVRRKRRYSKLPEPRPFTLVLDLTHPHRAHDRLIANFHVWIDAQIMHPDWIVWSAADRSYQDVIIAILYSHQRCLSDGTGLVANVGNHGQPGITQGGAFRPTTTFVKLDLLAHPVSRARNIVCHCHHGGERIGIGVKSNPPNYFVERLLNGDGRQQLRSCQKSPLTVSNAFSPSAVDHIHVRSETRV